jgi:hypothetical protein
MESLTVCEPATIAAVAAVTAAAASAVGTYGAMQQASYQEKVGNRNAKMADRAAVDAIERGKIETRNHYREIGRLRGQQEAAMAANGGDMAFGSNLDLLGDTAMVGAEDAEIIRENFMRESQGYSISAANYRSQAKAAGMSKVGILAGGIADMSSTILSGSSQMKGFKAGSGGGGGVGDMAITPHGSRFYNPSLRY